MAERWSDGIECVLEKASELVINEQATLTLVGSNVGELVGGMIHRKSLSSELPNEVPDATFRPFNRTL